MLLDLQSNAAGAYPKSQRSPAGTPSRFWKLLYGWFSCIAGCVPFCLFTCRPLVAGDIPINDPGCSPAEQTTRNAFRRRMSGWRYTTIPSLRILYCSVDRGTFSRAAAPRGPDRRPPVRRNASRIWARSFSSRLGRSVSFPLEGACSGISADADSERSCAGFAV